MTITYPSPIFGPIHSRRLGISLGVNLMPGDGKICSFDCIYCECGFNKDNKTRSKFPTQAQVLEGLLKKLQLMDADNSLPDVITFAGNGEPTGHPDFLEIIEGTISLRDKYAPNAKVSVLTNAAHLDRKSVVEALMLVDNNILKLDTVNEDFIFKVDRPNFNYSVDKIIDQLKVFNNKCIIQTMFLKGSISGENIDNTTDDFVIPWIKALEEIKPREVMIYTIDRETPLKTLRKANKADLDRIGDMVKGCNLNVQISY